MRGEEELGYFKGGLTLGISLGVLSGLTSMLWYQKRKTLSPDDVLKKIKNAFLKEGPIEGSWIEFEKKPLRKFAVRSKVYTGGICRFEDDELVHYEFLADAYTGTVVSVNRLKNE
ncbi:PepSY domain-containing protein [Melissococcus plutonius]|uniref:PepSY domain-containing protein n=1 Tax=Melissococcus plutonius TaxID=33970 RepID=UPI00065DBD10|nr:PepSY domain-containing protein [Melissococcus plutonius]AIM25480.1 putative small secreted protein [Melissococcus plutonius S1]KMT25759.1 putative small secreted protein [Melissococcus plutonius]KMT27104.1 putative small secreted protein [Melissococcus plutonius]KMT28205.1 putative small secreted protein [Melissococcus plutonius]KMT29942.1 putative small secreted protein [Melissococcus plutonius]